MDEQPRPDQTRREGIKSFPIQLSDGNLWGLALPTPRLRSRVARSVDLLGRPIETIQVVTEFGYPLEIRRLIDDLRSACERGTPEFQQEALFRLAASLLGRVHDLEWEEIAGLFEFDLDDLPEFVETILAVVTGECLETNDAPRKKEANA